MTFADFDKFSDALLAEVLKMRDTKGKEYAREEGNRMANFDRLSQRLGVPRQKVLMVYLTKHMDAIESYVAHQREFSTEKIRGRIVDAITYLTLLAGMVEEDSKKVDGIDWDAALPGTQPWQKVEKKKK